MSTKFKIENYHFNSGSLLDGLDAIHFNTLKRSMERKEVKKGAILYKRDSYSKGVYLLRKGKIKIYQVNDDGKAQIVYIYKKGEFFGYRPLLCNETHPTTAEVLENAIVSFIPQKVFMSVLRQSPELANKLLSNLSHEFSVWINTTTAFAQKSVRERLALALLILNEKFKSEKEIAKPTELNLKREDLASYVGTAVETLVRMMKELKTKKIISSSGRKIKILKPGMLEMLTEIY